MKDFKMDKTGWKTYRFDEFAQNISERVEPQQTDLTVYVGLEHLEPDCLHIRRHGSPSDVEGTKLKFYEGDIIFGKRRAYQRKSGLATTNGICSAHAMVLRAKEEVINPRLFPFIFHSKVFIDRAITISVGGLSPTINWKDLAKQEFCLPPKEQQARLAELLWAADEVVEREKSLKKLLKQIQSLLFEKDTNVEVDSARLKDCLVQKKIKSKAPHDKSVYIGLEHLKPGNFTTDIVGSSDEAIADCFVFQKGDLLYSKLRPYLDKAIIAECDGVCTTELIVYDTNQRALKEYVLNIFHSRNFLSYIIDKGFGTKMPRVSHEIVAAYSCYLPTIEEQKKILLKINRINNLQKQVDNNIFITNQIKQNLINRIF